jgi:hypothetical protein
VTQKCKRCRRLNPTEAVYCYFDGVLLEGRAGGDTPADGSAINIGARPFTVPFVLPSGHACANFLQLATACHQHQAGALDLLRKGHFETFFAAQGRLDLAAAAHAAARATNPERGLDDFLGRLPVPLTPARLRVEPALLDLGTVRVGEDRCAELTLHNTGMRLLYGSAECTPPGWPWATGRRNRDSILTIAFQDNPKDAVGAATMTFGLALAHAEDTGTASKHKRLIYDEHGRTNNVCYRLDGKEFLLGYEGGAWQALREPLRPDGGAPSGCRSVWLHKAAPVAVIQTALVIPGPQSGQPDTCLVRYTIENRDQAAHKVGLRFLLDTFIGSHDGVPFAVPGVSALCETSCDHKGADVSDFLEALETDDLKNPGGGRAPRPAPGHGPGNARAGRRRGLARCQAPEDRAARPGQFDALGRTPPVLEATGGLGRDALLA